ncbi:hypothetical protein ACMFMG_003493 [Clarireedia jacksonii]
MLHSYPTPKQILSAQDLQYFCSIRQPGCTPKCCTAGQIRSKGYDMQQARIKSSVGSCCCSPFPASTKVIDSFAKVEVARISTAGANTVLRTERFRMKNKQVAVKFSGVDVS